MILDHEFPPDIRVEKQIDFLTKNGYDIHILTFTKEKKTKLIEHHEKFVIHRKPISEFVHKTSVPCLLFPIYFNFWNKYILVYFVKYILV